MAAKRARRASDNGREAHDVLRPAGEPIPPDGSTEERVPTVPPTSAKRAVVSKENESRPSIFSVSSPVSVEATGGAPVGDALENCHNCWKKMRRDENVFMYSSVGFCSIECRLEQIQTDNLMENLTGKSARMKMDERYAGCRGFTSNA